MNDMPNIAIVAITLCCTGALTVLYFAIYWHGWLAGFRAHKKLIEELEKEGK
jgi:hypothetical protein